MDHTSVTVDVYSDSGVDPSAYRVYVDDDLLTERSWIWPSYEIFIREHMIILAEPGDHQVRIERCQGTANFSVRGFTVNGVEQAPANLSFNIPS
jgi:hypothetical protein